MKILELRTENIKNLKVVEIKPDGNAVVLTGKNGAGKSAVLDSIFVALTGKKLEQPIREGEARAEINVDLGKYKVRRIFTAKGERLEVTSAEGAVFKSPQALLDGIIGKLTFDPLAFSTMADRPRRDLLASLVGLDFAELDKRRLELYNERTVKNREIKGGDPTAYRRDPNAPLPLESLVQNMAKPSPETPRAEISMAEEIAKVEVLEDKAKIYGAYEREVEDILRYKAKCEEDIAYKHAEIKELQDRIALISDDITKLMGNSRKAQSQADDLTMPERISEQQISEARARLREVEKRNIEIRAAVEFDGALAKLDAAKRAVAKLEEGMMKIDLEKQAKVNAAQFPIPGLGITDEFVTFEGKPFGQLSTGQQIRISTAIAMAMNPEIRVIFIREGSLLDREGFNSVVEMAKEKDYQVWIEKVADAKGVGIYLEAGEIAGQQKLPPEG
jgi:ABC-type lipoprotein export system ATPase subunit